MNKRQRKKQIKKQLERARRLETANAKIGEVFGDFIMAQMRSPSLTQLTLDPQARLDHFNATHSWTRHRF